ncbi:hypothetical protein IQ07DRAFT_111585 [Pyrenochaeta sp. DS3sAY3a]|nr:hypothetical protein IQ07DRAFT_111585 [Pyrenochaeta sp. DS3sAY3a]
MEKFLKYLLLACLAVTAVLAAPTQNDISVEVAQPQLYYLGVNAPKEPWHERGLVPIPKTLYLGLENFTVSPTTPPTKFFPVQLGNGNFALRGESVGDDLSKTPYLAALIATGGTRTVGLKVVYVPDPTLGSFKANPAACPATFQCIADQWAFDTPPSTKTAYNAYKNLRFAQFKGRWEPFEDVKPQGWHVYWKANAGLHHPIDLDLVPVVKGRAPF